MTDKSAFTESEWHAVTDAPLLVTAAIIYVGEHGPISMVKEASASARSISKPGERGVANELIGQIVAEANTKEARADMKDHRGPTPQATSRACSHDLEPAAAALKKLPPDEAAQVAAWLVAIAKAVAAVSQDGEPRRAGDDREDRRALRRSRELRAQHARIRISSSAAATSSTARAPARSGRRAGARRPHRRGRRRSSPRRRARDRRLRARSSRPGFIDTHAHTDPAGVLGPRARPGSAARRHDHARRQLQPVAVSRVPTSTRGPIADLFAYIEDVPRHLFDDARAVDVERLRRLPRRGRRHGRRRQPRRARGPHPDPPRRHGRRRLDARRDARRARRDGRAPRRRDGRPARGACRPRSSTSDRARSTGAVARTPTTPSSTRCSTCSAAPAAGFVEFVPDLLGPEPRGRASRTSPVAAAPAASRSPGPASSTPTATRTRHERWLDLAARLAGDGRAALAPAVAADRRLPAQLGLRR